MLRKSEKGALVTRKRCFMLNPPKKRIFRSFVQKRFSVPTSAFPMFSQRCSPSMQASAGPHPPEPNAAQDSAHEPEQHVDEVNPHRILHARDPAVIANVLLDK
jgi:hypothetical protein